MERELPRSGQGEHLVGLAQAPLEVATVRREGRMGMDVDEARQRPVAGEVEGWDAGREPRRPGGADRRDLSVVPPRRWWRR
ncbi:MAG: hypothetical protein ACREMB_27895 [Candidatus Rokuibacteriota bacterium]